jgi:hypothetical protein
MLYNMAGRPFEQVHSQYVFPLLPVIAYQVLGVSAQSEVWVTCLSFVAALAEFFWIIARISKQYTRKYNVSFFTIKDKQ